MNPRELARTAVRKEKKRSSGKKAAGQSLVGRCLTDLASCFNSEATTIVGLIGGREQNISNAQCYENQEGDCEAGPNKPDGRQAGGKLGYPETACYEPTATKRSPRNQDGGYHNIIKAGKFNEPR